MKTVFTILAFTLLLNASSSVNSLTLNEAIEILQTQNLEIKAASFDVDAARSEEQSASGMHFGTLDFTQDFANSNDAGNVFGFKLASREASFGDFGAREFMSSFASGNPDFTTPPRDLNYPQARNFFQSKLKYQLPLFTGFAISSYEEIMSAMKQLKTLEKEQIIQEKIFELRKSYYDMALLNDSVINLEKILKNITKLEDVTAQMIDEGYAKKIDLLEVQAKKGNVERLLMQMHSNEKLLYHYISFLLNKKITSISFTGSDVTFSNHSTDDILSKNLDLKKAKTGLELRKSMVTASEASNYPTLGTFAELSTANNTFLGDADDRKAYTVGARLSWNLFNGGIDTAKIEKSKIEQLKMHSQVELARQGVILEVTKINTEIESINEEIESLEKELILAEAIYSSYLERYKEKLVSMSDVIIKQSGEIEKILQLQIAKNSRNEKLLTLEKLVNGEYK